MKRPIRPNIWQVDVLFLRLGATASGGPAAHIAMMHDEVVKRRQWLGEQEFLDLVGATNLIPGPNSTEMAIHLGLVRGGLSLAEARLLQKRLEHVDQVALPGRVGAHDALFVELFDREPVDHGEAQGVEHARGAVGQEVRA